MDKVKIGDRAEEIINNGDTEDWVCKQSDVGPCVFMFTSSAGRTSMATIHTDELDAIGTI